MRIALTVVFAALTGLALLLALATLTRPVVLFLSGRRVKGVVASEHLFRSYGTRMRFYRVTFPLSTGQEANIRSSATAAWLHCPPVGSEIPVLVSESGNQPRACIAIWHELWLGGLVALLVSIMAAAVAAFVALGSTP